jgi:Ca-activated chloride channel family protein
MSRGVTHKVPLVRLWLVGILALLQVTISVRTELVAVPVSVTDARGHHVSGLTRENFRVLEDGRAQPIAVFHHGEAAVSVGLIVDRSQSMRMKGPALAAAVSALLRLSRADDELFGVAFNDRVSFALPAGQSFTSEPRALVAALTAVRAEGRTALYDGVAAGLEHLQRGHPGTHALVVVSDGGDNASVQTYARILELARRSDAVVYAVGLLGTSAGDAEENSGLLRQLCRDTGGVAYFPRTPDEITAMSAEVARDLREKYTLGFVPTERADHRPFRAIDVKVIAAGHGRLQVRTRAGYFASSSDTGRQGGRDRP